MTGSETTAKALGYAGLIPFVVFSIGCWIPVPYVTNAPYILITYGAVILSFMGAVHWGVAMANKDQQQGKFFISSVLPALIAWPALLLAQSLALVILLAGFIGLYTYDRSVEKAQALPGWYIPMRTRLTAVVVLCLASALLSVIMN
ncbi:MAG: DUF3429 domain-containing protein [Arenicellales bacterium]